LLIVYVLLLTFTFFYVPLTMYGVVVTKSFCDIMHLYVLKN